MPQICINELGSFSSGNDLSPVRYQAITWTNAGLLSLKSPRSGVTLCFQFVSATASAAATIFASHVKTVWAKS